MKKNKKNNNKQIFQQPKSGLLENIFQSHFVKVFFFVFRKL